MRDRTRWLTAAALLSILASPFVLLVLIGTPVPDDRSSNSADGYWRSRGYGIVIQVRGASYRRWDEGGVGCRTTGSWKPLQDSYSSLEVGDDGRRLTLQSAKNITTYKFDRLPALPAPCGTPIQHSADPLIVFDDFVAQFDQHYAFFEERAVNWKALANRERQHVTARTSDAQLYAILRKMASATNDLHVSIDTPFASFIPGMTDYMTKQWADYAALSEPKAGLGSFLKRRAREHLGVGVTPYLDPASIRALDENVLVATIRNGTIGYIQVLGESDFAHQPEGHYRLSTDISAARRSLDAAFRTVRSAKALIIDLRINYGGQDTVSLLLAGYLTDRKGAGFTKCARWGDRWTEPQKTVVEPSRLAFLNRPVILLISGHTISAGDEFLMIAKDYPHVRTVGETSPGDYSDPTEKTLPNGWTIGIPNERYFAPDGVLYEGHGIAPDVRVNFAPELMAQEHRDPAIEKSLDIVDLSFATKQVDTSARSRSREHRACGSSK